MTGLVAELAVELIQAASYFRDGGFKFGSGCREFLLQITHLALQGGNFCVIASGSGVLSRCRLWRSNGRWCGCGTWWRGGRFWSGGFYMQRTCFAANFFE